MFHVKHKKGERETKIIKRRGGIKRALRTLLLTGRRLAAAGKIFFFKRQEHFLRGRHIRRAVFPAMAARRVGSLFI